MLEIPGERLRSPQGGRVAGPIGGCPTSRKCYNTQPDSQSWVVEWLELALSTLLSPLWKFSRVWTGNFKCSFLLLVPKKFVAPTRKGGNTITKDQRVREHTNEREKVLFIGTLIQAKSEA